MKKRIYRAVAVKQVNEEKLWEAVRGLPVVFGVDVAKEVCFGAVMTEGKQVLATVKWRQPEQTTELVAWLQQLPALRLEVAMEPSSTYGDALRWQLGQAGIPVFRVSGKRCHDAAEVYDGVPSMHDAKSAQVLGRLHLEGISQVWQVKCEAERILGAAVRTMDMYEDQYQRCLRRIESQLGRHWPELTTVMDLTGATTLAVLERFGGPQGVREEPRVAVERMRKVGRGLLAPEKIQRVIEGAQHSVGAPMLEAEREALEELTREAIRCRKASRKAARRVEQLGQRQAPVSRLSRLVGKVTAAVLFVAAGNPREYVATRAYVKALGLNLKIRSSGIQKGHLKITKRGPSEARRYLYLAALRLIREGGDRWVRAWYLRKVKRDGGRRKGQAVIAVMRKLAAALWHVADGVAFDSTRLFDVRRLQAA